jgi:hypothetical protein
MQKFIFLSLALLMFLGFSSCKSSDGGTDVSENLVLLEQIVPNYVNNTVIPTYKLLADKSIDLCDALGALKAAKSDDNVQNAVNEWIDARKYWELSEAFLFGAAADFGIDPHIDTWPLARNDLLAELNNSEHIASMNAEDGAAWVGAFLGASLLGFHGIEYVLFADGQPKQANQITASELIYAFAVAGDLRNQCIRLEAAWAGYENVSAEKQEIIDEFELGITFGGTNYGINMKDAGKAGSTYKSFADAAEAIINGCIDISDEVQAMKLGKPFFGSDINYIESQFSYNSTTDFADNIESIRNAYLGGLSTESREESLHTFFEKTNKDLDDKIIAAIDNSVSKINDIRNFEQNFTAAEVGNAIDAIKELTSLLEQSALELRKAIQ